MKYTIAIEKTIVQDFFVEADSAEEALELAIQRYKNGEFVLNSGGEHNKQITTANEVIKWKDFTDWRKRYGN